MSVKITRRNFIRAVGAGAVTGVLATSGLSKEVSAEPQVEHHAILFDGLACTGCELCQYGCKVRNNLPLQFETFLTPSTYVYVSVGAREGKEVKVRYSCMHCHDAPCKNVCPVSAIKRSRQGLVHIDPNHCIGCEYCVAACPYGVPKFDHEEGVATKCTGCYDLVEKGDKPACVQACPWNALFFGKREDMVKKARDIQAENPDATIYGLEERTGLNVIYVLPVEPVKNRLFPEVRKVEQIYPLAFIYQPLLMGLATIVTVALGAQYWKQRGEKK